MKITIRKFVLAVVVALACAGSAVPAHATVSGSEPRPTVTSTSLYLSVLLSILVY